MNTQVAQKKLTITLTDARPVTITEANWPIIAESKWTDHDGQVECQANRRWNAWLKVRQHADGRTIVYGHYSYSTQFQDGVGATHRDGQRVDPSAEEYPVAARADYWAGESIVRAIRSVGESLADRSGHGCWRDLIAECIADLPAEEVPDTDASIDAESAVPHQA